MKKMSVLEELISAVIGNKNTLGNKIWSYITDHISKDRLSHIPTEFSLGERTRKITFYYYAGIYYLVNITYKNDINKVIFKFSYEDEANKRIVPILTYTVCDRETNVRAIKIEGHINHIEIIKILLDNFFVDIYCKDFINFLCSDEICRSEGKFKDISFINIPNELIK